MREPPAGGEDDVSESEMDTDDGRVDRPTVAGHFASPVLPSSSHLSASSTGHSTPNPLHTMPPSPSRPASGNSNKDVLEREFRLAAAELQRAALSLRRFQDRRGLSAFGGASYKLRSNISRDALSRSASSLTKHTPVARHQIPMHRGVPLRRQRRASTPVAGPSSVTIEDMEEAEVRRKAAAAKNRPIIIPGPIGEDFIAPAKPMMTRARARALMKGKGKERAC